VFLGVKPQMMAGVLSPLQPIFAEKKPILVSMAAGLSLAQIESFAGTSLPIIRIMPNTPAAVGMGMITYDTNAAVTPELTADFLQDMAQAGTFDALPEKLMDAATAVAGCGPAYMYMMIEAMADGAVVCGLPRDKAMRYAAATMAGAAQMVLQSGQHPGALKDAVCSPGGSTIAGVSVLEQRAFRGAVMDCVKAAYKRNQELGK
jgi:pyrroline-5-carboxylate reductase